MTTFFLKNEDLNIRSSADLQRLLADLVIQDDDVMVTFYVVAMFPSIPVDLACALVMDRWQDIKIFAPMTQGVFKEILELCLTSGYCVFEDQFYKQKNDLSMRSSWSPFVAELAMDHVFRNLGKGLIRKR